MTDFGTDWLEAVTRARAENSPCVLVTVAEADGSTPRGAGTKMVVFADGAAGTIGGGALEYRALEVARGLLADGAGRAQLREFPLGPALGQCCGGHVSLLFEPMSPPRATLLLFGAGHVGRALVSVLDGTGIAVRWIDSRVEEFPDAIPAGVTRILTDAPEAEVESAPAGAAYLVMTHSHAIDLALVEAILRRDDFVYLGLIGSRSKRARFERRLRTRTLPTDRLVCPIGIDGVTGKRPKEIAIAVAAQLLQRLAVPVGAPSSEEPAP
ncbi:MAG: xanthine dehydrogenase accessory protein XdhC [Inquilinaceae bacterium]